MGGGEGCDVRAKGAEERHQIGERDSYIYDKSHIPIKWDLIMCQMCIILCAF